VSVAFEQQVFTGWNNWVTGHISHVPVISFVYFTTRLRHDAKCRPSHMQPNHQRFDSQQGCGNAVTVIHINAPLSPSSIIWYWPMAENNGGFDHLLADCPGLRSAPEPYSMLSMGLPVPLPLRSVSKVTNGVIQNRILWINRRLILLIKQFTEVISINWNIRKHSGGHHCAVYSILACPFSNGESDTTLQHTESYTCTQL